MFFFYAPTIVFATNFNGCICLIFMGMSFCTPSPILVLKALVGLQSEHTKSLKSGLSFI
jgi:hypothetical protein